MMRVVPMRSRTPLLGVSKEQDSATSLNSQRSPKRLSIELESQQTVGENSTVNLASLSPAATAAGRTRGSVALRADDVAHIPRLRSEEPRLIKSSAHLSFSQAPLPQHPLLLPKIAGYNVISQLKSIKPSWKRPA
jgi:hypothetical protein